MPDKKFVWGPEYFRDHYESGLNADAVIAAAEERKLKFYMAGLSVEDSDVILDIGCGYGRMGKSLAHKVHHYYGIDINPANLAYATQFIARDNFSSTVVDLSTGVLPFEDCFFDKIVFDNVSGYLDPTEQKLIFHEIERVLKPEGVVVYNFQNKFFLLAPFRLALNKARRFNASFNKKATPKYYSYSIYFYKKLLNELGFELALIGDTLSFPVTIKGYQIIPGIFSSVLRFADNAVHKSFFRYIMSSCSCVAKKSKVLK